MARIVLVGETLVDVVCHDGVVEEHPGGCGANTAMALARLGYSPMMVTQVGEDERGKVTRKWFERDGVQFVSSIPGSGRTIAGFATIGADGGAQFTFDGCFDLVLRELDRVGLVSRPEDETGGTNEQFSISSGNGTPANVTPLPDVVHVGSISTVLSPGNETVLEAARRAAGRSLVIYDPNVRPALNPESWHPMFLALSQYADIVKISDEDIDRLGETRESALTCLFGLGVHAVVMTLGSQGTEVHLHDRVIRVTSPQVEVADTIGAGDTFTGAMIDALIHLNAVGPQARPALQGLTDDQWTTLLTWANLAASVTVGRPGCDPPTLMELQVLSKANGQQLLARAW